MGGKEPVQFVANSAVRSAVLDRVTDGPTEMSAMIDAVDASESAIYGAVDGLERRDLIRSEGDGFMPTGSGVLVADAIDHQRALGSLLEDEYWRSHDVSVIPQRFRQQLTVLSNAEILRASEPDPHELVREIAARVEAGAPAVDVASPIYHTEYEAVMPDDERARLLLDTSVVTSGLDGLDDVDRPAEAMTLDATAVRIGDVSIALSVTDDHLMLSLPTLDGQYDSRTEVIATDECALAWGRDLFEFYWANATPAEVFLRTVIG